MMIDRAYDAAANEEEAAVRRAELGKDFANLLAVAGRSRDRVGCVPWKLNPS